MARQPHHLPPRSRPSESADEEHYSTSRTDDDSGTQKPPSPACMKTISKPTHFNPNAKRPEQQVSKSKKSKSVESVENVDKVSMSDKSKSVENVDKGSKSNKGKNVQKVDKGSTSDVNVDKGSKKSQTNIHGDDSEIEDKKEALFTRLFTEKDEIVLLEGMIHYKQKKGADPSSNMVAFHKFIEGSLSCSVAKKQIVDKISKLKRKFMNNVRKGLNAEDPVFSKPHEYKLFKLSQKMWACEVRGTGDSRVRSSRKNNNKDDNVVSKTLLKLVGKKESDIEDKVMDKTEAETEVCWSLYPCLCASLESEAIKNVTAPMSPKEYVMKVVSGLEKEKARELEQEWKGFVVMEQEVYAKRAKMICKQAEAAMNPHSHSGAR